MRNKWTEDIIECIKDSNSFQKDKKYMIQHLEKMERESNMLQKIIQICDEWNDTPFYE